MSMIIEPVSLGSGLYCSHWGLTDLYAECEEKLRDLLQSGEEFITDWCGSKKEIISARYSRHNGVITVEVCQSIDDLDDLLRSLCGRLLSGEAGKDGGAEEEDEIAQAARYMEEHYSDPEISITALADSFELSMTRFSLSFKEKMGMSPLDYLTLLRVEHAKELLASSELTIRDISAQVGYYDSGSFIRRFKQVTGETPLQYRRGRDIRNRGAETEPREQGGEEKPE